MQVIEDLVEVPNQDVIDFGGLEGQQQHLHDVIPPQKDPVYEELRVLE
jgi:hypothetical protein